MKALITFGCSWTHGIGSWVDNNLPDIEPERYKKITKEAQASVNPALGISFSTPGAEWTKGMGGMYQYSYRSLLTERKDCVNINFGEGGSSNTKQFRRAEEYFNTDQYKKYDEVIVLWGLTSTARIELWFPEKNRYKTFFLSNNINLKKRPKDLIRKILLEDHYNHDEEVNRLSIQMQHWDDYFKMKGIRNYWYDTFNHHNYEYKSPNMIMGDKNPRDLMSNLCIEQGMKLQKDGYHYSFWTPDNDRIKFLIKKRLVNPLSVHPNKQGSLLLADILDKYVNFC